MLAASSNPGGEEVAIRHPKRGKAHRRFSHWETTCCRSDSAAGMRLFASLTESIPVAQTDPADRCSRCWPPTGSAR